MPVSAPGCVRIKTHALRLFFDILLVSADTLTPSLRGLDSLLWWTVHHNCKPCFRTFLPHPFLYDAMLLGFFVLPPPLANLPLPGPGEGPLGLEFPFSPRIPRTNVTWSSRAAPSEPCPLRHIYVSSPIMKIFKDAQCPPPSDASPAHAAHSVCFA